MTRKIKVMIVVPTLGAGGAERLCVDIARLTNKSRFDICIVSLYSQEHQSSIYDNFFRNRDFNIIFLRKKKGFSASIIFHLIRLMNSKRPDIVHSHIGAGVYAMISAAMCRIRVRLHTVHTLARKEFPPLHRLIMKCCYRWFGVVPVAISPKVRETVQEIYRLQEAKVRLINNGVDLSRFVPRNIECKHGSRFIAVGRLSAPKNHALLLNAFALTLKACPKGELVLVGDGELRDTLRDRVGFLLIEKNVRFTGIIPNVEDELKRSDIFVLASDYEGFGLVIAEAMACGLPVISTRNGGAENIIADEVDGFLVPVGDAQGLSEKMIYLARRGDIRHKMGAAALLKSKNFDLLTMIHKYESLYEEMTNG